MISVVNDSPDEQVAAQLERVIRRVKRSMSYYGSYTTRDILGSLVARWVQSGEWNRLKELPAEERRLSESVRRFILDRFEQLRRRGHSEPIDAANLAIPPETELSELVELADLRCWIANRVAELEAGNVDPRVRIPIPDAAELGRVLSLHLAGRTQREIARALDVSLGVVNKRISAGTSYLAVLHGVECGIG